MKYGVQTGTERTVSKDALAHVRAVVSALWGESLRAQEALEVASNSNV
jgi:hypothetical protein